MQGCDGGGQNRDRGMPQTPNQGNSDPASCWERGGMLLFRIALYIRQMQNNAYGISKITKAFKRHHITTLEEYDC